MSYNFINEATSAEVVNECFYDTSVGYESDFSENGNVDGWSSFTLMHTYGVWGGFLFATLYGPNAYIGRGSVFTPVAAETHYTVKIAMKLNPQNGSTPATGRVAWTTVSNPSWDSTKTLDFTIYADNVWHNYILNMGNAQWWQGDVTNLRIYPMLDGDDGDEFFIRGIKIDSVATFQCFNPTCSFYSSYEHPCQGIGSRGYCQAQPKESNFFDIISDVNDELVVNINSYGSETITLASGTNISGDALAKDIARKISQVDVGGYAEANVTYSEFGRFKVYSGTYTDSSTVRIEDSSAAETLGFFESGVDVSSRVSGEDPATGFKPKSSFKIKTFQLLELFDNSEQSYLEFNPFIYNVEGGRRDWVENGLGTSEKYREEEEVATVYGVIENEDKTIIDFNHPFNASGRIKKLYIVGSVVDEDGNVRTDCKLKVLRMDKEGQMKVIHTIDVPDRTGGKLYSTTQEYIVLDCDLWVNKGDLLGAYNIDMYVGKSYSELADALYFQPSGEVSGQFDQGEVLGDGNAGFFFYARSEDLQKALFIDIDLGKRVNIEEIDIKGESETSILEYNIARCVDIDWQVELFGETHDTGYWHVQETEWRNFNHANVAYGISNLTDGIYGNENAEAAESYAASDADGIIPTNPNYFWVNGDEEWVGQLFHVGLLKANAYVINFEEDPIAFTILFPSNRSKRIFKSVIYFKERYNFRSFALSQYMGPDYTSGNADNPHFRYIDYNKVGIDSNQYYEGSQNYGSVEAFLFANPCDGRPSFAGGKISNYDEWIAAEKLKWNVLSHEFGPITCKGFRIYTDFHKSTKINEIELYGYVENVGTGVTDSVSVRYSQYEELWIDAEITTNDDGSSTAFIGSTPQYFRIQVEPISALKLSDLTSTVKIEDVYSGEKGCAYNVLLDHTKIGVTNESNRLEFKNVYDKSFSLYVDIPEPAGYAAGPSFYSLMNNEESILKPVVGPGAYINKKEDYPLILRDNNCAINCPCYGLKNLIDGKNSYYSFTGLFWSDYGTLTAGESIDAPSVVGKRRTIINLPVIHRAKYWKMCFLCSSQSLNVREMRVSYQGVEYDCEPYYDTNQVYSDPISNPAPHLTNDILTASYYNLSNDDFIGFELDGQHEVDQIVLYHDSGGSSTCGVDGDTQLYLKGNDTDGSTDFIDYSYKERTVGYVGSDVYISFDSYFGSGAIRFEGNSYLTIPHDVGFNPASEIPFSVEFFVKFKSAPTGTVTFIKNWDGAVPTYNQEHTNRDWVWALILRGGLLQFWSSGRVSPPYYATHIETAWSPTVDQWYHIRMCEPGDNARLYIDGIYKAGGGTQLQYSANPLIIGENFDGLIDNLILSNGSTTYPTCAYADFTVPTAEYERAYTLMVYTSSDNLSFSEYNDPHDSRRGFEIVYPTVLSYYDSDSEWNNSFYSYFAVDLGKRYSLQIVRNYSGSNLLSCSLTHGVDYSAEETENIEDVTFSYGTEYTTTAYPVYSQDDGYCASTNDWNNSADYVRMGRYLNGGPREYTSGILFRNVDIPQRAYILTAFIRFTSHDYRDGDYRVRINANAHDNPDPVSNGSDILNGRTLTTSYTNLYSDTPWYDGEQYDSPNLNGVVKEIVDRDGWQSGNNMLFIIRNFWASFQNRYRQFSSVDYNGGAEKAELHITYAVFDGTARWIRFGLLSGSTSYIRKLGIYPDITNYIAPGGGSYNHEWESLGTSTTTYTAGTNVALGATVSGSSNFGQLYLGKTIDGIVGDTITEAWGSDTDSTQWIEISFARLYSIYRVKMYHGYSEDDTDYIIEDYNIQVSTDGSTYDTIFTITGNSDFEREHVLSSPVNARSLKINITGYSTGDSIYLPTGGDAVSYDWFQGAVLREVEVNEYYGFDYVSSEDYPIIALNLLEQFQINNHTLVGIDPEDTSTDWSNTESNFCYSDSVLDGPKKISFSAWGSGPGNSDKWVAIKRDTATGHDDGPDYLKHAKILSSEDQNPCEYHWWWSSSISTLSSDYSKVKNCVRSLKIDYPTGSGLEHVYLIEGDTFGTDEDAAWRDALGFHFYIDDIDKLDDSYGYIYFGDVNSADYVEYRWNFSGLHEYMESGWNEFFLRFKSADDIVYVENNDPDALDPRILSNRELKSLGMRFRGTGQAMTIRLDGFEITRNTFNDFANFDYGFYITKNNYISAPLADFTLRKGTVEFYLRPDYNPTGTDYFGQFKYRSLFHFANVANDVFGAMVGLGGFIIYVGNLGEEPIVLSIEAPYWDIDDLFHLGFVYSSDGTAISSDGSTLRLYFNNHEIGKITETWDVHDSKHFKFFIGGKSLHAVKEAFESSSVDAVMANFKVHNYCKTDFSTAADVNTDKERLLKPNELIEISKDNVTFYSVGDPNLPLIYESVPVGDTVYSYARSSLPDDITGREKREASILASWHISV